MFVVRILNMKLQGSSYKCEMRGKNTENLEFPIVPLISSCIVGAPSELEVLRESYVRVLKYNL